jgi:DNA primase
VQKLFRFTDSVVFSFDGDAAGRRAARKALDGALPYATDVRSIKFLFLPAEHDPDSFIREHGAEAFARFVNEATPLSRFLIEAAREGCDLGTAEGRAHAASNAKPLWTALPDGALKRQLLGEIAELVQLSAADLTSLWTPAAPPPARHASPPPAVEAPRYEDDGTPITYERRGKKEWRDKPGRGNWGDRRPPSSGGSVGRTRLRPPGRADIAARLLLSNMHEWEALSHELHGMLCDLPGEHGALFTWLDGQCHEHGVQPWAALREGLRGQSFETLADGLMTGPEGGPVEDPEGDQAAGAAKELRNVLDFMLDDLLKAHQSEAIAAVGSDPSALERYKALEVRRLELRHRLKPSVAG